jgi:hypothetical protein
MNGGRDTNVSKDVLPIVSVLLQPIYVHLQQVKPDLVSFLGKQTYR